jgi:tRNA 2-thiocytidine biosynthesis protein TtcA
MRPYQELFNGRLTLIRPLAYVEEKDLARLVSQLDLPVIASRCPRAKTSKRRLVKDIIGEVRKHNRNVKKNIFRSLQRVRQEYLLGTEQEIEPGRFCDEA